MMEENRELGLAWDLIENTGTNLFLTGRAGTGKTTFLKKLKEKCPKRMVVLAPTGIAAINAGGMTIHSFFQLPFAPFVPETSFSSSGKAKYGFRFGKEKIRLIRSTDLVVIDEISMVRADLLDAVDNVLRRFRDREKPFGGVQLLMIGDLQQLSPVVKDEEWDMLKEYYDTPYFFSSHALKSTDYCTVELKTVYRQRDETFLNLLNAIRENRCSDATLDALNGRYIPGFRPAKEEGYIRLVTHNHQAQRINARELELLPDKPFFFKAEIEGKFPDWSFPTEEVLELKRGAQIMFVKNDSSKEHRFFNGMLGEITGISKDGITVRNGEGGEEFALQKEEWTNAKYVLDSDTKEIREEIEGVFRQYPVRLAWAITIHKSQGLTFDRAIIDAGYAFSHGQTYVALSRCRTLEGLVLSTPLSRRAIITDAAVEDFTERARLGRPDEARLRELERAYFCEQLSGLFDFQPLLTAGRRYVRFADEYFRRIYPQEIARYKNALVDFTEKVEDIAGRFRKQYLRMVGASEDYAADPAIQERIHAGAVYFKERLEAFSSVFSEVLTDSDNKDARKRLKESSEELKAGLMMKLALLDFVSTDGFDVRTFLKRKALLAIDAEPGSKKSPKSKASGSTSGSRKSRTKATPVEIPSDILHPELYEQLVLWRRTLAAARKVPAYVILQQKALLGIANLLPTDPEALLNIPYFGKAGFDRYGDAILDIVRKYCIEIETGNFKDFSPRL